MQVIDGRILKWTTPLKWSVKSNWNNSTESNLCGFHPNIFYVTNRPCFSPLCDRSETAVQRSFNSDPLRPVALAVWESDTKTFLQTLLGTEEHLAVTSARTWLTSITMRILSRSGNTNAPKKTEYRQVSQPTHTHMHAKSSSTRWRAHVQRKQSFTNGRMFYSWVQSHLHTWAIIFLNPHL